MKNLYGKCLILATMVLMAACNRTPGKRTTYVFREVGWTVTLPAGFKVVDDAGVKKMREDGQAMLEKTAGKRLNVSASHTLITARKGSAYLTATFTPFDVQRNGDFATANQTVKSLVYRTLADQIPGGTLDSASDFMNVGGQEFYRYRVSVSKKGQSVFTICRLNKLYKGHELAINYLYADETTKAQMESILDSSKFQ